jgi:hypothetical protein
MIRLAIIGAALALTGCAKPEKDDKAEGQLAWRQCMFELDKIEAIRGRNLDDLNRGMGVARNQFLMDCMASRTSILLPEHLDDMMRYAAPARAKLSPPAELNLNNGTKRL